MASKQTQSSTSRFDEPQTTFGLPDWLLAFFLTAFTLLAYQPVWHGLPIWDDWRHVTRPDLASVSGLCRIWLEPGITRRFDPLVDTVFWIENRLWGAALLGHHLVSITCHVGAALLLVAILRRLHIRGAWLAAAIFALHPVHAESVAWISELKNTMSGAFFLGTVLAYLKFDERRTPASYAMAVGLFLGALLSKTTTVVWPIGMIVIVWWKRGALSWKRDVRPLIPFAALALFDGWVALGIEHKAVGKAIGELHFSLPQRLAIAGHATWFYLEKLLWPVGLCPIYPRWQIDHLTAVDYLYPIGIVALLVVLWTLRKRGRAPFAALLFFVGALSPLLGMFSFSYQRYSFVADHFQYLASLGVITLVAGGGVWLQERWHPLPHLMSVCLCLTMVAMLAILTWQHSGVYADLGTFARTTLAGNPDCWVARDLLGVVLTSEGKPTEAIDLFNQALQANPRYGLAHYDLGSVLQSQGRVQEAVQQYQQAIEWQPGLARPRYNLGCIFASRGQFAEAIKQYQDALQLEPYASEVRNNLGIALASSGKLDEAIEQFQRAVKLRSDFAEARVNLGHALTNQRRFTEAIQQYDEAVRLDPTNGSDHYDLAIALAGNGDLAQAAEQLREAARLKPDQPDVQNALARVLEKQGLQDEARRQSVEAERRATPALQKTPNANPPSSP